MPRFKKTVPDNNTLGNRDRVAKHNKELLSLLLAHGYGEKALHSTVSKPVKVLHETFGQFGSAHVSPELLGLESVGCKRTTRFKDSFTMSRSLKLASTAVREEDQEASHVHKKKLDGILSRDKQIRNVALENLGITAAKRAEESVLSLEEGHGKDYFRAVIEKQTDKKSQKDSACVNEPSQDSPSGTKTIHSQQLDQRMLSTSDSSEILKPIAPNLSTLNDNDTVFNRLIISFQELGIIDYTSLARKLPSSSCMSLSSPAKGEPNQLQLIKEKRKIARKAPFYRKGMPMRVLSPKCQPDLTVPFSLEVWSHQQLLVDHQPTENECTHLVAKHLQMASSIEYIFQKPVASDPVPATLSSSPEPCTIGKKSKIPKMIDSELKSMDQNTKLNDCIQETSSTDSVGCCGASATTKSSSNKASIAVTSKHRKDTTDENDTHKTADGIYSSYTEGCASDLSSHRAPEDDDGTLCNSFNRDRELSDPSDTVTQCKIPPKIAPKPKSPLEKLHVGGAKVKDCLPHREQKRQDESTSRQGCLETLLDNEMDFMEQKRTIRCKETPSPNIKKLINNIERSQNNVNRNEERTNDESDKSKGACGPGEENSHSFKLFPKTEQDVTCSTEQEGKTSTLVKQMTKTLDALFKASAFSVGAKGTIGRYRVSPDNSTTETGNRGSADPKVSDCPSKTSRPRLPFLDEIRKCTAKRGSPENEQETLTLLGNIQGNQGTSGGDLMAGSHERTPNKIALTAETCKRPILPFLEDIKSFGSTRLKKTTENVSHPRVSLSSSDVIFTLPGTAPKRRPNDEKEGGKGYLPFMEELQTRLSRSHDKLSTNTKSIEQKTVYSSKSETTERTSKLTPENISHTSGNKRFKEKAQQQENKQENEVSANIESIAILSTNKDDTKIHVSSPQPSKNKKSTLRSNASMEDTFLENAVSCQPLPDISENENGLNQDIFEKVSSSIQQVQHEVDVKPLSHDSVHVKNDFVTEVKDDESGESQAASKRGKELNTAAAAAAAAAAAEVTDFPHEATADALESLTCLPLPLRDTTLHARFLPTQLHSSSSSAGSDFSNILSVSSDADIETLSADLSATEFMPPLPTWASFLHKSPFLQEWMPVSNSPSEKMDFKIFSFMSSIHLADSFSSTTCPLEVIVSNNAASGEVGKTFGITEISHDTSVKQTEYPGGEMERPAYLSQTAMPCHRLQTERFESLSEGSVCLNDKGLVTDSLDDAVASKVSSIYSFPTDETGTEEVVPLISLTEPESVNEKGATQNTRKEHTETDAPKLLNDEDKHVKHETPRNSTLSADVGRQGETAVVLQRGSVDQFSMEHNFSDTHATQTDSSHEERPLLRAVSDTETFSHFDGDCLRLENAISGELEANTTRNSQNCDTDSFPSCLIIDSLGAGSRKNVDFCQSQSNASKSLSSISSKVSLRTAFNETPQTTPSGSSSDSNLPKLPPERAKVTATKPFEKMTAGSSQIINTKHSDRPLTCISEESTTESADSQDPSEESKKTDATEQSSCLPVSENEVQEAGNSKGSNQASSELWSVSGVLNDLTTKFIKTLPKDIDSCRRFSIPITKTQPPQNNNICPKTLTKQNLKQKDEQVQKWLSSLDANVPPKEQTKGETKPYVSEELQTHLHQTENVTEKVQKISRSRDIIDTDSSNCTLDTQVSNQAQNTANGKFESRGIVKTIPERTTCNAKKHSQTLIEKVIVPTESDRTKLLVAGTDETKHVTMGKEDAVVGSSLSGRVTSKDKKPNTSASNGNLHRVDDSFSQSELTSCINLSSVSSVKRGDSSTASDSFVSAISTDNPPVVDELQPVSRVLKDHHGRSFQRKVSIIKDAQGGADRQQARERALSGKTTSQGDKEPESVNNTGSVKVEPLDCPILSEDLMRRLLQSYKVIGTFISMILKHQNLKVRGQSTSPTESGASSLDSKTSDKLLGKVSQPSSPPEPTYSTAAVKQKESDRPLRTDRLPVAFHKSSKLISAVKSITTKELPPPTYLETVSKSGVQPTLSGMSRLHRPSYNKSWSASIPRIRSKEIKLLDESSGEYPSLSISGSDTALDRLRQTGRGTEPREVVSCQEFCTPKGSFTRVSSGNVQRNVSGKPFEAYPDSNSRYHDESHISTFRPVFSLTPQDQKNSTAHLDISSDKRKASHVASEPPSKHFGLVLSPPSIEQTLASKRRTSTRSSPSSASDAEVARIMGTRRRPQSAERQCIMLPQHYTPRLLHNGTPPRRYRPEEVQNATPSSAHRLPAHKKPSTPYPSPKRNKPVDTPLFMSERHTAETQPRNISPKIMISRPDKSHNVGEVYRGPRKYFKESETENHRQTDHVHNAGQGTLSVVSVSEKGLRTREFPLPVSPVLDLSTQFRQRMSPKNASFFQIGRKPSSTPYPNDYQDSRSESRDRSNCQSPTEDSQRSKEYQRKHSMTYREPAQQTYVSPLHEIKRTKLAGEKHDTLQMPRIFKKASSVRLNLAATEATYIKGDKASNITYLTEKKTHNIYAGKTNLSRGDHYRPGTPSSPRKYSLQEEYTARGAEQQQPPSPARTNKSSSKAPIFKPSYVTEKQLQEGFTARGAEQQQPPSPVRTNKSSSKAPSFKPSYVIEKQLQEGYTARGAEQQQPPSPVRTNIFSSKAPSFKPSYVNEKQLQGGFTARGAGQHQPPSPVRTHRSSSKAPSFKPSYVNEKHLQKGFTARGAQRQPPSPVRTNKSSSKAPSFKPSYVNEKQLQEGFTARGAEQQQPPSPVRTNKSSSKAASFKPFDVNEKQLQNGFTARGAGQHQPRSPVRTHRSSSKAPSFKPSSVNEKQLQEEYTARGAGQHQPPSPVRTNRSSSKAPSLKPSYVNEKQLGNKRSYMEGPLNKTPLSTNVNLANHRDPQITGLYNKKPSKPSYVNEKQVGYKRSHTQGPLNATPFSTNVDLVSHRDPQTRGVYNKIPSFTQRNSSPVKPFVTNMQKADRRDELSQAKSQIKENLEHQESVAHKKVMSRPTEKSGQEEPQEQDEKDIMRITHSVKEDEVVVLVHILKRIFRCLKKKLLKSKDQDMLQYDSSSDDVPWDSFVNYSKTGTKSSYSPGVYQDVRILSPQGAEITQRSIRELIDCALHAVDKIKNHVANTPTFSLSPVSSASSIDVHALHALLSPNRYERQRQLSYSEEFEPVSISSESNNGFISVSHEHCEQKTAIKNESNNLSELTQYEESSSDRTSMNSQEDDVYGFDTHLGRTESLSTSGTTAEIYTIPPEKADVREHSGKVEMMYRFLQSYASPSESVECKEELCANFFDLPFLRTSTGSGSEFNENHTNDDCHSGIWAPSAEDNFLDTGSVVQSTSSEETKGEEITEKDPYYETLVRSYEDFAEITQLMQLFNLESPYQSSTENIPETLYSNEVSSISSSQTGESESSSKEDDKVVDLHLSYQIPSSNLQRLCETVMLNSSGYDSMADNQQTDGCTPDETLFKMQFHDSSSSYVPDAIGISSYTIMEHPVLSKIATLDDADNTRNAGDSNTLLSRAASHTSKDVLPQNNKRNSPRKTVTQSMNTTQTSRKQAQLDHSFPGVARSTERGTKAIVPRKEKVIYTVGALSTEQHRHNTTKHLTSPYKDKIVPNINSSNASPSSKRYKWNRQTSPLRRLRPLPKVNCTRPSATQKPLLKKAGERDVTANVMNAKGYAIERRGDKSVWRSPIVMQEKDLSAQSIRNVLKSKGTENNKRNSLNTQVREQPKTQGNDTPRETKKTTMKTDASVGCNSEKQSKTLVGQNMNSNMKCENTQTQKRAWGTQDTLSPLDEASAVYLSMCVVSQTLDPFTGKPILKVTGTDRKSPQAIPDTDAVPVHSCSSSILSSSSLIDSRGQFSDDLLSSDSFQSLSGCSDDYGTPDASLQKKPRRNFEWRNTAVHEEAAGHLSRNQNASDPSPKSSAVDQTSLKRPLTNCVSTSSQPNVSYLRSVEVLSTGGNMQTESSSHSQETTRRTTQNQVSDSNPLPRDLAVHLCEHYESTAKATSDTHIHKSVSQHSPRNSKNRTKLDVSEFELLRPRSMSSNSPTLNQVSDSNPLPRDLAVQSTSSEQSTISVCSGREELSVSEKISYFNRKMQQSIRAKASRKSRIVEGIPVKDVCEHYESTSKATSDTHTHRSVSQHSPRNSKNRTKLDVSEFELPRPRSMSSNSPTHLHHSLLKSATEKDIEDWLLSNGSETSLNSLSIPSHLGDTGCYPSTGSSESGIPSTTSLDDESSIHLIHENPKSDTITKPCSDSLAKRTCGERTDDDILAEVFRTNEALLRGQSERERHRCRVISKGNLPFKKYEAPNCPQRYGRSTDQTEQDSEYRSPLFTMSEDLAYISVSSMIRAVSRYSLGSIETKTKSSCMKEKDNDVKTSWADEQPCKEVWQSHGKGRYVRISQHDDETSSHCSGNKRTSAAAGSQDVFPFPVQNESCEDDSLTQISEMLSVLSESDSNVSQKTIPNSTYLTTSLEHAAEESNGVKRSVLGKVAEAFDVQPTSSKAFVNEQDNLRVCSTEALYRDMQIKKSESPSRAYPAWPVCASSSNDCGQSADMSASSQDSYATAVLGRCRNENEVGEKAEQYAQASVIRNYSRTSLGDNFDRLPKPVKALKMDKVTPIPSLRVGQKKHDVKQKSAENVNSEYLSSGYASNTPPGQAKRTRATSFALNSAAHSTRSNNRAGEHADVSQASLHRPNTHNLTGSADERISHEETRKAFSPNNNSPRDTVSTSPCLHETSSVINLCGSMLGVARPPILDLPEYVGKVARLFMHSDTESAPSKCRCSIAASSVSPQRAAKKRTVVLKKESVRIQPKHAPFEKYPSPKKHPSPDKQSLPDKCSTSNKYSLQGTYSSPDKPTLGRDCRRSKEYSSRLSPNQINQKLKSLTTLKNPPKEDNKVASQEKVGICDSKNQNQTSTGRSKFSHKEKKTSRMHQSCKRSSQIFSNKSNKIAAWKTEPAGTKAKLGLPNSKPYKPFCLLTSQKRHEQNSVTDVCELTSGVDAGDENKTPKPAISEKVVSRTVENMNLGDAFTIQEYSPLSPSHSERANVNKNKTDNETTTDSSKDLSSTQIANKTSTSSEEFVLARQFQSSNKTDKVLFSRLSKGRTRFSTPPDTPKPKKALNGNDNKTDTETESTNDTSTSHQTGPSSSKELATANDSAKLKLTDTKMSAPLLRKEAHRKSRGETENINENKTDEENGSSSGSTSSAKFQPDTSTGKKNETSQNEQSKKAKKSRKSSFQSSLRRTNLKDSKAELDGIHEAKEGKESYVSQVRFGFNVNDYKRALSSPFKNSDLASSKTPSKQVTKQGNDSAKKAKTATSERQNSGCQCGVKLPAPSKQVTKQGNDSAKKAKTATSERQNSGCQCGVKLPAPQTLLLTPTEEQIVVESIQDVSNYLGQKSQPQENIKPATAPLLWLLNREQSVVNDAPQLPNNQGIHGKNTDPSLSTQNRVIPTDDYASMQKDKGVDLEEPGGDINEDIFSCISCSQIGVQQSGYLSSAEDMFLNRETFVVNVSLGQTQEAPSDILREESYSPWTSSSPGSIKQSAYLSSSDDALVRHIKINMCTPDSFQTEWDVPAVLEGQVNSGGMPTTQTRETESTYITTHTEEAKTDPSHRKTKTRQRTTHIIKLETDSSENIKETSAEKENTKLAKQNCEDCKHSKHHSPVARIEILHPDTDIEYITTTVRRHSPRVYHEDCYFSTGEQNEKSESLVFHTPNRRRIMPCCPTDSNLFENILIHNQSPLQKRNVKTVKIVHQEVQSQSNNRSSHKTKIHTESCQQSKCKNMSTEAHILDPHTMPGRVCKSANCKNVESTSGDLQSGNINVELMQAKEAARDVRKAIEEAKIAAKKFRDATGAGSARRAPAVHQTIKDVSSVSRRPRDLRRKERKSIKMPTWSQESIYCMQGSYEQEPLLQGTHLIKHKSTPSRYLRNNVLWKGQEDASDSSSLYTTYGITPLLSLSNEWDSEQSVVFKSCHPKRRHHSQSPGRRYKDFRANSSTDSLVSFSVSNAFFRQKRAEKRRTKKSPGRKTRYQKHAAVSVSVQSVPSSMLAFGNGRRPVAITSTSHHPGVRRNLNTIQVLSPGYSSSECSLCQYDEKRADVQKTKHVYYGVSSRNNNQGSSHQCKHKYAKAASKGLTDFNSAHSRNNNRGGSSKQSEQRTKELEGDRVVDEESGTHKSGPSRHRQRKSVSSPDSKMYHECPEKKVASKHHGTSSRDQPKQKPNTLKVLTPINSLSPIRQKPHCSGAKKRSDVKDSKLPSQSNGRESCAKCKHQPCRCHPKSRPKAILARERENGKDKPRGTVEMTCKKTNSRAKFKSSKPRGSVESSEDTNSSGKFMSPNQPCMIIGRKKIKQSEVCDQDQNFNKESAKQKDKDKGTDKDINANKKTSKIGNEKRTTTFRILAEPSCDKNKSPSFRIEMSPPSSDSSDEPMTRLVKMEECCGTSPSSKLIMTEFRCKAENEALDHSFPTCATKMSLKKAMGCITSTRETVSVMELPCSSSSDLTLSVLEHVPNVIKRKKKIVKQSSVSTDGGVAEFKIQAKSPPKRERVSANEPRVYSIDATITNRSPVLSGSTCQAICSVDTIQSDCQLSNAIKTTSTTWCGPRSKRSRKKRCKKHEKIEVQQLQEDDFGGIVGVSSSVITTGSCGKTKKVNIRKVCPTDIAQEQRCVIHQQRDPLTGRKTCTVTKSVSKSCIPNRTASPVHCPSKRCAKASHVYMDMLDPQCSRSRQTRRIIVKEQISSDSAMEVMSEALLNLKQKPHLMGSGKCAGRGIQNFRLAHKSSSSVVSVVSSCGASGVSSNQLRTTHSFSVKRNIRTKRLASIQEEAARRLGQARRTLRNQEMLAQLTQKTQFVLSKAIMATRREIVEEKMRTRHKQLQAEMKRARVKRLLHHSQRLASAAVATQLERLEDTLSTSTITVHEATSQIYQVQSPCNISRGVHKIYSQTHSVEETPSNTYYTPHVMQRRIVDKLCHSSVQVASARRLPTLLRHTCRRNRLPNACSSTQLYRLDCANNCSPRRCLSDCAQVATRDCPLHGRKMRQHICRKSKSDSTISYTSVTNLKAPVRRPATNSVGREALVKKDVRRISKKPWGDTTVRSSPKKCMHGKHIRRHNNDLNQSRQYSNQCQTTEVMRTHEDYFTHLQRLAKQVASDAFRKVGQHKDRRAGQRSCALKVCESRSDIQYLLTLNDVSRMVAAVTMAALDQGITRRWKGFCSVLLQPTRQVSFTEQRTSSHPSGGFHRTTRTAINRASNTRDDNQFFESRVHEYSDGCSSEISVSTVEISSSVSCETDSYDEEETVRPRRKCPSKRSEVTAFKSCCSFYSTQEPTFKHSTVLSESILDRTSGNVRFNRNSGNVSCLRPERQIFPTRTCMPYNYKPATTATLKVTHSDTAGDCQSQVRLAFSRGNPAVKNYSKKEFSMRTKNKPNIRIQEQRCRQRTDSPDGSYSMESVQCVKKKKAPKIFMSTLPEDTQKSLRHRQQRCRYRDSDINCDAQTMEYRDCQPSLFPRKNRHLSPPKYGSDKFMQDFVDRHQTTSHRNSQCKPSGRKQYCPPLFDDDADLYEQDCHTGDRPMRHACTSRTTNLYLSPPAFEWENDSSVDMYACNGVPRQHACSTRCNCSETKVIRSITKQTRRQSYSPRHLKSEVRLLVEDNMHKLVRDYPQEMRRLSYHQLLRANGDVLDCLQMTSTVDADSLNKAFREAVYQSYLCYHQPDIYFCQEDEPLVLPCSAVHRGKTRRRQCCEDF